MNDIMYFTMKMASALKLVKLPGTRRLKMETMKKDFVTFIEEARKICPHRVFTEYLLRYAYGVDASCYSYLPEVVVKANNELEVVKLVRLANTCGTPVTFRAAGSSLSGQACSENVLIVANDGFKYAQVLDDGKVLRAECGVIGADANEVLKPYGKKIGPDPATITTALVGGIVNNNSSGMCCGTAQNSYKTIRSIRVVLADGTILDTGNKQSVERFLSEKSDMVQQLLTLRQEVVADSELVALIERKYKIKNTTGYGLNSLVDYEDIIDIINHLFVGSEGTLGFVSEVVYDCVEDVPFKGCGLVFYEKLSDASQAVVKLAGMPRDIVVAAEMMDYLSLKSVQGLENVPSFVKDIPVGTSCILFQSESTDEATLDKNLAYIKEALQDIPTVIPSLYSKDAAEYDSWWLIRKGLLPIVAGQRKSGSTVITEDVCFKIEDFCDGIEMISELFRKYDFVENGVIFGHALSGNVHFIITPDFNNSKEMENFAALVKEMAEKVAGVEGSIKAEHGTGRMVAPFVELEWGEKAYAINRRIKQIFDPTGLLNPDVMITDDPDLYKKNLKAQSEIDPLFNMCMECGFCEKNCPSRNLTLTPRQRIALLREETRLRAEGQMALADELKEGYEYYGQETCAACSMCKQLCPLGIDTAQIALSMRRVARKGAALATKLYDNFEHTLQAARAGVTVGGAATKVAGHTLLSKLSENIHDKTGLFPYMPSTMPKANYYKLEDKKQAGFTKNVVYFSTCANRAFRQNQGYADTRSLQQVFESLCAKAGYNVIYPPKIEGLCCGLSFENYEEIDARALADLSKALTIASRNGEYPVVIDHSACFAHAFTHLEGFEIMDIAEFLYTLLPDLDIKKTDEAVMVHKQCKIKVVNKSQYIELVAKACTDKVYNIKTFACDGFAGQKGFFTPELNKCATKDLAAEIMACGATLGVSSSSTCEIGLGENGGIPFVSVAYLLDRCASAKK